MAGKLLLDTSVAVDLIKHIPKAERVVSTASELFLAAVALGELLYGANHSARRAANLASVDELVASVAILPCDAETAWHYGEIKAGLRSKGRPLPDNDVWIAAVARQHQLIIATRDAHFLEIDGVATLSW
jgi:tRNA(fMet)-specific endonuclease VapC